MKFVAWLLICALCTLAAWAGVRFGRKLNERHVAAVQTKPIGLVSPPLDTVPPQVEVGELPDGVLHLPPTVVVGVRPTANIDASAPVFFDFHHATCDTAESVRGEVVRCYLPKGQSR